MTPQARTILKQAVSDARRVQAAVLIADYGTDDCDWCLAPIHPRRPKKRFCSSVCAKRWNYNVLNPGVRSAAW
jgi:hypothetical protein